MIHLRLLFVAAVWGINFSVIKFSLASFHPLAFTVVRFAFAALFLFSLMLVQRQSFVIAPQDRTSVFKLGLSGIALYNLFFMYGLKHTTAANSALLISLSPLFGTLIQAIQGKERLTARISVGMMIAFGGVFLIIKGRFGDMSITTEGLTGDLLTLCATATWAYYTLAAKPLLERYSAITITAYAMATGSILLLPFSLPGLAGQQWSGLSLPAWSSLAFATFIAAGIAYVFWYEGVKRIGVTRTIVYHYLMPFAAVLFAAFALKERISLEQIIGGAAILSGVFIVQSRGTR